MRKVWSEEAWEDYLYWQTKNYNLSNIIKNRRIERIKIKNEKSRIS